MKIKDRFASSELPEKPSAEVFILAHPDAAPGSQPFETILLSSKVIWIIFAIRYASQTVQPNFSESLILIQLRVIVEHATEYR